MNARVDKLWHKDSKGMTNPQDLVGNKYIHVATSALYVVTGFAFNATSDLWVIRYDRWDEHKRKDFEFTRDVHEFLDGRFVKVT